MTARIVSRTIPLDPRVNRVGRPERALEIALQLVPESGPLRTMRTAIEKEKESRTCPAS